MRIRYDILDSLGNVTGHVNARLSRDYRLRDALKGLGVKLDPDQRFPVTYDDLMIRVTSIEKEKGYDN